MSKSINKSFRIKPNGIMTLDRLCDYMQDTSRSDICVAALAMYSDYSKGNLISHQAALEEEGPLEACEGIIKTFLRDSYKNGKTKIELELIQGSNHVIIPRHTRLTFAPPYTIYFTLNRLLWVRLDLSTKLQVRCINVLTENELNVCPQKWSQNEKIIINLDETRNSFSD